MSDQPKTVHFSVDSDFGFLLRNNVSLSLLARNACEDGISATELRELILNSRLSEEGVVPESVYKRRDTIKAFLNVFEK